MGGTPPKRTEKLESKKRRRGKTSTFRDLLGNIAGGSPSTNKVRQAQDSHHQTITTVTNNEEIVSSFGPFSYDATLKTKKELRFPGFGPRTGRGRETSTQGNPARFSKVKLKNTMSLPKSKLKLPCPCQSRDPTGVFTKRFSTYDTKEGPQIVLIDASYVSLTSRMNYRYLRDVQAGNKHSLKLFQNNHLCGTACIQQHASEFFHLRFFSYSRCFGVDFCDKFLHAI